MVAAVEGQAYGDRVAAEALEFDREGHDGGPEVFDLDLHSGCLRAPGVVEQAHVGLLELVELLTVAAGRCAALLDQAEQLDQATAAGGRRDDCGDKAEVGHLAARCVIGARGPGGRCRAG